MSIEIYIGEKGSISVQGTFPSVAFNQCTVLVDLLSMVLVILLEAILLIVVILSVLAVNINYPLDIEVVPVWIVCIVWNLSAALVIRYVFIFIWMIVNKENSESESEVWSIISNRGNSVT